MTEKILGSAVATVLLKAMVARTVGALIVGGAIGATAGLLLAPDKGKETRKSLKKKFKNLTSFNNEKEKVSVAS